MGVLANHKNVVLSLHKGMQKMDNSQINNNFFNINQYPNHHVSPLQATQPISINNIST